MEILDVNNQYTSSTEAYVDAYIEKVHNKLDILFFSIPKSLGSIIQEEGYVELPEGRFTVKEKKINGKYYDIVCKPDLESFEVFYPNYTYTTRSFKSILDAVLTGTGWTCICPGTANKTLTGKNRTKFGILQHALELFGYEVRYDLKNKIIYADTILGEDKGAYFHHDLNLRELTVSSSTYDYCTRIIPIGKNDLGIESVNGGLNYLEPTVSTSNKVIYLIWTDERYTIAENLKAAAREKIDTFSKPYRSYEADLIDLARLSPSKYSHLGYQTGDIITLVDRENKSSEKQRVILKKEYLRDRLKDTATLSNRPKSITEDTKANMVTLQSDISVVKQYIEVLEGEITSKVQAEVTFAIDGLSIEAAILKQPTAPDHLADRLWLDTSVTPNILKRSTGTEWVNASYTSDGIVAVVRNNANYTADLAAAAASRDTKLLKALMEPVKAGHADLISRMTDLPTDDTILNTAASEELTAYNVLQTTFDTVIGNGVIDAAEWTSFDDALAAYQIKEASLATAISKATFRITGTLAYRLTTAEEKITADSIINTITSSEMWQQSLSEKLSTSDLAAGVDNILVNKSYVSKSTVDGQIDTLTSSITSAGESIKDLQTTFIKDINGLSIASGLGSTMELGSSSIRFLMAGMDTYSWDKGVFYTKDVQVTGSIQIGNHKIEKNGTEGTIFVPMGGM